MTFSANAPNATLPLTDTIPCDYPCSKCGYNLRTLGLDAACPECATPVRAGLPEDEQLHIGWLDERSIRSLTRRELFRTLAVVVTLGMFLFGAVSFAFGINEFTPPSLLVTLVLLSWTLHHTHKKTTSRLKSWRLFLGQDAIATCSNLRNLMIRREAVTKISQRGDGVIISSGRHLFVGFPREVDHYEVLLDRVTAWRKLEPISSFAFESIRLWVMILYLWFVACGMPGLRSPHWIVAISAVGIVINCWLVWFTIKSPALKGWSRWFLFFVLTTVMIQAIRWIIAAVSP